MEPNNRNREELFEFGHQIAASVEVCFAVDRDNRFGGDTLADPTSVYTDVNEFTFQWK